MTVPEQPRGRIPSFSRNFFASEERMTRIGRGAIGGKASGLVLARDILADRFDAGAFPEFEVDVPRLVCLGTDVFEAFLERNHLGEIALSDRPDDRLAHEFQKGDLPIEVLGDLRALVEGAHTPLAVRSSSLLEDALGRPFAGVYATKMTPNNQADADSRFRRLVEAIKFVYASTFFRAARNYVRATDQRIEDERMAVVIQEVVGRRHGDRFYPHLSGVARSHDYYPHPGADPSEGVVNLALGLGKTIVDGGVNWSYSPARPKAPPPFASPGDLMKNTQLGFWGVNMGKPPAFDPLAETEFLCQGDIQDAERDGVLAPVASTYMARSDRFSPGVGAEGPRVLDFAPLLTREGATFNALIRHLLDLSEAALEAEVEIELAGTFPAARESGPARIGFLQVRPMVVSEDVVEVTEAQLSNPGMLVASDRVMGNGIEAAIRDVVYVRPERFEARYTRDIAGELETINNALFAEGKPYLLIGFGRWGSSDPWLGIPVDWGQICGARAIVETTLPTMNVEPSQGAHFFHNISSFRVSYFTVHHEREPGVAWDWLNAQPALTETEHLRHVSLDAPVLVQVDGRSGRGVIHRRAPAGPAEPRSPA